MAKTKNNSKAKVIRGTAINTNIYTLVYTSQSTSPHIKYHKTVKLCVIYTDLLP